MGARKIAVRTTHLRDPDGPSAVRKHLFYGRKLLRKRIQAIGGHAYGRSESMLPASRYRQNVPPLLQKIGSDIDGA
jgi:hypothetical protein